MCMVFDVTTKFSDLGKREKQELMFVAAALLSSAQTFCPFFLERSVHFFGILTSKYVR